MNRNFKFFFFLMIVAVIVSQIASIPIPDDSSEDIVHDLAKILKNLRNALSDTDKVLEVIKDFKKLGD